MRVIITPNECIQSDFLSMLSSFLRLNYAFYQTLIYGKRIQDYVFKYNNFSGKENPVATSFFVFQMGTPIRFCDYFFT